MKVEFPETKLHLSEFESLIESLDESKDIPLIKNGGTYLSINSIPEVVEKFNKYLPYNLANRNEYPHINKMESLCIGMLADLWNGSSESFGSSTTGSSEAILMASLVAKLNWRKRIKESNSRTPNIVISRNSHSAWEKVSLYLDIELRYYEMDDQNSFASSIDNDTVMIVGILGITQTGSYENISLMDSYVDALVSSGRIDNPIPIHIDAAIGGFVAPFIEPDLAWDFRLKNVQSINASGHKYGLTYPGLGWIVWKDKKNLPQELITSVDYLSGVVSYATMSFSRSSSHIAAQYTAFNLLGRSGYTSILKTVLDQTFYVNARLTQMEGISTLTRSNIPVASWTTSNKYKNEVLEKFSEYLLKNYKLSLPTSTLYYEEGSIKVQRFVIKYGLSYEVLAELMDLVVEVWNSKFAKL